MPESICQNCGGAVIRETQGVLAACPECFGLPPQPPRERPSQLVAKLVVENRRLRQLAVAWLAYDLAIGELPDRMPEPGDCELVRVRHIETLRARALKLSEEALGG